MHFTFGYKPLQNQSPCEIAHHQHRCADRRQGTIQPLWTSTEVVLFCALCSHVLLVRFVLHVSGCGLSVLRKDVAQRCSRCKLQGCSKNQSPCEGDRCRLQEPDHKAVSPGVSRMKAHRCLWIGLTLLVGGSGACEKAIETPIPPVETLQTQAHTPESTPSKQSKTP